VDQPVKHFLAETAAAVSEMKDIALIDGDGESNFVSGKPEAFHALAFGSFPRGLSFGLPVARGRFSSHMTGGCSSDFCARGAGHF
jgi:hypothetical protein